ncbi:MAG: hypothetical protein J6R08_06350 [Opitutales bacterium]|nr:hypothetical protein [Opitutales bacterium]
MKRKIIAALLAAGILISAFGFAFFALQKTLALSALKSANEKNDVEKVDISFFKTEMEGLKLALPNGFDLSIKKISASHGFILKCLIFKDFAISDLKVEGASISQAGAKEKSIIPVQDAVNTIAPAAHVSPSRIDIPNISKPTYAKEAVEKPSYFSDCNIKIKNIEGDFEANLNNGIKISAILNSENRAQNLVLHDLFKLASLDLHLPFSIKHGGGQINAKLRVLAQGSKKATDIAGAIFAGEKEIFKSQIKASDFYKRFETQTQISLDSNDLKFLFDDLPQFSVKLHSAANFDADLKNAGCKASFRADAQNLRELSVYLDEVKTASLAGEIEFKKELSSLDVGKLNFGLNINESNVCAIKSAKRFVLDARHPEKIPDGELFRFLLNKFDLSHLNAFIKQNGFEAFSAPVSAEILISKNSGSIEAKSEKLIGIKSLTLKRNGAPLLDEASFNLFLSATTDFEKSKISAQFTPASVSPNFSATVEASFAKGFERADFAFEVSGDPSPLFPKTKECGIEKINAEAAAAISGNLARIKKFAVNLRGKNGADILTSNIKNEIRLDLSSGKVSSKDAEIGISSADLPPEILKAFCPNADAEKISLCANVKILSAEDAEADISVDAKNLSASNESGEILKNITLEAKSKMVLKNGILDFDIPQFKILENATGILTGSANAKFGASTGSLASLKSANAEFSASVPKLLQQPFLKKFDNASNGMLEAKLNAQGPTELKAEITLSNLSARGTPDLIEKAELKSVFNFGKNCLKNLSSKLRIATTRGESLINLNMALGEKLVLDADSSKIVLEDLQTLIGAFQNRLQTQNEKGKTRLMRPRDAENAKELPSAKEIRSKIKRKLLPHETDFPESGKLPKEAAAAIEEAQEAVKELPQESAEELRAVWDFGKDAEIKISAQKILSGGTPVLENLKAEISADKTSIKAADASALFYGAPSALSCNVFFAQNGVYELKNSRLKIENLEIQKLLKKNGEGFSFIEGAFDIEADFFASSKDFSGLPRLAQFNASAKTKGGTMHILDRTSDIWEAASIGAGLLKIGGALLGGKVREIGELTDVMELLASIEFSETTLSLKRGVDLNIELLPAEVKAQNALLSMRGSLKYMERESFANMPIFIPIKLDATEGRLALALQKLGYEKTPENIVSGPEFQIFGTLSNTKNNLKEILAKSARSIFKVKN